MGPWRFYQNHSAPIDTTRFSLMAGATIPTYAHDISADAQNAVQSAAVTGGIPSGILQDHKSKSLGITERIN